MSPSIYTEDEATRVIVRWVTETADVDDLAATLSELVADAPVIVQGHNGAKSLPYQDGQPFIRKGESA